MQNKNWELEKKIMKQSIKSVLSSDILLNIWQGAGNPHGTEAPLYILWLGGLWEKAIITKADSKHGAQLQ